MKHFDPRAFAGDLIGHLPGAFEMKRAGESLTINMLSIKTKIDVGPGDAAKQGVVTITPPNGESIVNKGVKAPFRALAIVRRIAAGLRS